MNHQLVRHADDATEFLVGLDAEVGLLDAKRPDEAEDAPCRTDLRGDHHLPRHSMEREGADEIDGRLRTFDGALWTERRLDVERRRRMTGHVEDVGAEHVRGRLLPRGGVGLSGQAEGLAGLRGVGEQRLHVEDELAGVLRGVEDHPSRCEPSDDSMVVAEAGLTDEDVDPAAVDVDVPRSGSRRRSRRCRNGRRNLGGGIGGQRRRKRDGEERQEDEHRRGGAERAPRQARPLRTRGPSVVARGLCHGAGSSWVCRRVPRWPLLSEDELPLAPVLRILRSGDDASGQPDRQGRLNARPAVLSFQCSNAAPPRDHERSPWLPSAD